MSPLPAVDKLRSFLRARRRPRPAGRPRRRPLGLERLESRDLLSTWTPLANLAPSPTGTGTMMLLTDGTVLVQGGGVANTWYKLTPDASGSYANGTWSQLTSMSTQRLFFGSNVLPSGKVFVMGGEYSGPAGAPNESNTGEIYDPVANSWAPAANFPEGRFGDDPTEALANGSVLAGSLIGPETYLYTPATNTWSQAGTKLRHDASSEEGWITLPDGSVLSYDVDAGTATAQRYVPSTNIWVDAGTVPVQLSSYGELGPAFLLPDGRALYFGDNGRTAYYTPSTNTWAAGPVIPNSLAAADVPGAMLPNGDVLIAAGTSPHNGGVNGPTTLFELDPTTNTYTNVTPGSAVIDTSGSGTNDRMLVLPSGQVLFTTSGDRLAVYTPSGAPNPSWQPTVSSVVSNGGLTYTLTGTQLNGISEGAAFGDDAEMSSNYPIVQLVDGSGNVYTARTFNWTSQVATGDTPVTTQFTLPAGLPVGTYSLVVVANGIASAPVSFQAQLAVLGSSPADGSTVSTPPTSFVVQFNEPIDPSSLQPGALQVNGIGADDVTLDPTDTTATFTYLNSPVTAEGVQTMTIADSTLAGQDGSLNTAFSASFAYDAVALAVTSTNPPAGSVITLPAGGALTYDVNFNEPIDPSTAGVGNLVLNQGTVTAATVLNGNTTIEYTIAGLADGPLTVGIPAGQVLDAADNPGFTSFSGSYTVDILTQPLPTPLTAVAPAGSLIYGTSASDLIGFAGDSDNFTLAADPGQTITVLVTATSTGLQPTIQLFDPSGTLLGSTSASGPGHNALLQTVATTAGGTYTVTVAGAGSTTGGYTVQVYLDAAVEASSQGIGTDGTRATAQNLDPSFVTAQTSLASASQAAVLGSVGFAPVTLNASFSGWWDNTGFHDATNPNYIAGQYNNPPLEVWHDFLVFNLAGITHPITGAQLSLSNPSNGYYSPFNSDTYTLFDVSTPIPALEASGTGQVGIFNDLGSGTSYGSRTVSRADNGQIVSITLNAAALSALNGSLGGQFAVGGALTSLVNSDDQAVFSNTGNNSQTKQLLLTFTDTPHYYSLTLAAGEQLTVGLKNLTGTGDDIAIQDASGNTLATGVAGAANLDWQIRNFVAPASGTYYVVVSETTTNATYSLVLTRDAVFDTKPNTTFATAQDVTGAQGAFGALTSTAGAVVPGIYANTETFNGNAYPFNLSQFGIPSMRYQQLYSASDLGPGGVIDAIRFRRSSGQGVFTSTTINVSISLGYAATTVATASPNFADNIGPAGLVNVYTGPLVLASTAANGSPQAFDILINLMNDFTYDPSQGDLLLDIAVSNSPGSGFFLEATPYGAQSATTRIFAFDVNAPVGIVGFTTANPGPYGLVTRFDFVAPPQPDWYKVTLTSNQTALQVETSTPLVGPNQVLNVLNPQIQLYDSTGTLIATGSLLADGRNQSLLATGLTSGATYYVEVTSTDGSTGEYFLGVTPRADVPRRRRLQVSPAGAPAGDSGRGFRVYGPVRTTAQGAGHGHAAVGGGTELAPWPDSGNLTVQAATLSPAGLTLLPATALGLPAALGPGAAGAGQPLTSAGLYFADPAVETPFSPTVSGIGGTRPPADLAALDSIFSAAAPPLPGDDQVTRVLDGNGEPPDFVALG